MRAVYAILAVLLAATILAGCTKETQEKSAAENSECTSDDDCVLAGCSGQVCAPKEKASDIITDCEWKEEYSCHVKTSCGCVEGSCAWRQTPEFLNCLGNVT